MGKNLKKRIAWNKGIKSSEIEKKKIGIGMRGIFNFVKDKKTKSILVRDFAYAEICREKSMSKPAIILYGSIIEEVLRYKLNSKAKFSSLIDKFKEKKGLDPSLIRKIDFIKDFRDYVHIFLEKQGNFEPTEGIASVAGETCKAVCEKFRN